MFFRRLNRFTQLSIHRTHRILYITRAQIIPPKHTGGIKTPKNVTIYLPDEIAGKMEKYPEVNWSEICRKAVADYIETRSHTDIASILEKLKAERNEAYKQGQILFYELAQKLDLRDFEILHPKIDTKLLESTQWGLLGEKPGLSPEAAERFSINQMEFTTKRYCKDKNITCPTDTSDAFWEGARAAFMNIYSKIKSKKS